MNNKYEIKKICSCAYETLIAMQDESGEFGRNCLDIIHHEDSFRHSVSPANTTLINKAAVSVKPNCSVTLISALGISCYKGLKDNPVIKAKWWFTESEYISKGWFRQQIHVVDANPFGQSIPQISIVTDVRHTATALLAALCFDAPVTFIADALRNLLRDECRDSDNKGWKSDMGVEAAPTDFYTTVYMLASLFFLKTSHSYETLQLTIFNINQLLNNGLSAICSQPPYEIGYSRSIEQTLRANATVLFFLSPLLADIYPEYLEQSVKFIISQAHRNNNLATWIDGDFDTTINILAGLTMAQKYFDKEKADICNVIKEAKLFVESEFNNRSTFHPVSLGFILFIYNNVTYLSKAIQLTKADGYLSGRKSRKEETMVDILLMVSTKEEEEAITNLEHFDEQELDNGISYLARKEKGLNIAMARGFEYGELDAAIMAQTIYMQLNPKILAMAGFCAGKRGEQVLGDVVIAERVFNYDNGKQVNENTIEPQISSYNLDTRIKRRIERYDEKWRYCINLEQPKDFDLQCYEFLQEISSYSNGVRPETIYNKTKYPNWKNMIELFIQKKYIETLNYGEQIVLSQKGKRHLNELFTKGSFHYGNRLLSG